MLIDFIILEETVASDTSCIQVIQMDMYVCTYFSMAKLTVLKGMFFFILYRNKRLHVPIMTQIVKW